MASPYDDEGYATETSVAQQDTEAACAAAAWSGGHPPPALVLHRDRHVAYLLRGLGELPPSYISLDASRCWIVYWVLHSLDMLGVRPVGEYPRVIAFLARCQAEGGGFGGGPGALPHTAATYAAVLALLVISTPEALGVINRPALLSFYRSLKDAATGGFRVQPDGEMDVRGSYTVLAVCSLLNLLEGAPDLAAGTGDFLLSCQSHEGGFGGEPGCEAHGGYTFCALAGLTLLGQAPRARVDDLTRWLVRRQMPVEGGFQGRTNKLVDACYSFWAGACFLMLPPTTGTTTTVTPHALQPPRTDGSGRNRGDVAVCADADSADILMDRAALQRYTLLCSQEPAGGLRDKPGKSRDFYHSCYSLAGLSIAQQDRTGCVVPSFVLGGAATAGAGNALLPTHPVYNILWERVAAARSFFAAVAPAGGPAS